MPLGIHNNDVIMGTIASQITSPMIVSSIVDSDGYQRKHQSSASLAFVRGIHQGPVNSPHKWPVTRKIFPFDDVIMLPAIYRYICFLSSFRHTVQTLNCFFHAHGWCLDSENINTFAYHVVLRVILTPMNISMYALSFMHTWIYSWIIIHWI